MTEDGGRVIPGRDPGLERFPEVLVLERFLERSSSITSKGGVPAKAINFPASMDKCGVAG
jgi:hypothetical protein